MSTTSSLRRLVVIVAALAVAVAACSADGSDDTTTTTAPDVPVVFGDGDVPETVPDGFPFPEPSNIGSTMVDYTRDVTELSIVFGLSVSAVAEYYETNLDEIGFTVDASDGDDTRWEMAFSDDDLTGEIVIQLGGENLSQGTIRLERVAG